MDNEVSCSNVWHTKNIEIVVEVVNTKETEEESKKEYQSLVNFDSYFKILERMK